MGPPQLRQRVADVRGQQRPPAVPSTDTYIHAGRLLANPADAERFMVQKAHTFIDQMGDRMFEPRKPADSQAS